MKHLPLTEADWGKAPSAQDYFPSLANYKNMVQRLYQDATVMQEDAAELRTALQAVKEAVAADIRVVVMTEDWCGDSANVLPYLTRLAESVDLPIHVFRQPAAPHLKAWFEGDGTDHIPVVSVVAVDSESEQPFVELVRWVERPKSAGERYEAWSAEHPELDELRAKKDQSDEANRAYIKVYSKLLRDMGSWYTGGLWRDIGHEISADLLRAATEHRTAASQS